jgi:HD superfamily phosphohydrolase YqeK
MKDVSMSQLAEAAEEIIHMKRVTHPASELVKYLVTNDKPDPMDFVAMLHDYTGTVITITMARVCSEFYTEEEMDAKKDEYLNRVTDSLVSDIESYIQENDDSI